MFRPVWILILLAAVLVGSPARAENGPAQTSTALQFIPADTGLYLSFLRWGEQATDFVASKAYQKLVEDQGLPTTFRDALDFAAEKLLEEEQLEHWETFWADADNDALLDVIEDAVSQEVVYHSDNGFAKALAQFYELSADQNRYQADVIGRLAMGDFNERPDDLGKIYLKHLKSFELPGQTLAFRITDADAAEAQIARVETLAQLLAVTRPEFAKAVSRKKLNGAEFLVLELHGGMIPKDAFAQSNLSEEMQAELLAALKDKKAAVALGVWNGYLVLHVGATTAGVEKLGKGPLLAERPEFARLKAAGAKPFTSVQFASKELMRAATNDASTLDSTLRMIPNMLRGFGADPDAVKDVESDIAKMSQEIETPDANFGANAYFSYRIPGGYETFDLNWTKQTTYDGSQPLTVLDHVGGSPLFFGAGRMQVTGAWYDRTSFWVARITEHVERLTLSMAPIDDASKAEYAKVRAEIDQIARRFDEITRTNLLPALKDGQFALVFDAKLKDKEWFKGSPTDEPLAAPEVALALGINQAGLFRQAGEDYLRLAQESLKRLSEFAAIPIPKEFEVPAPQQREFPEGDIYYYRAGAEALNAKFAPNVGLSDQFAIFSFFPQHSKRMLAATPLSDPGPLAVKKPRAAAVQIQIAAIVDVVDAWLEYAESEQEDAADAASKIEGDADASDEEEEFSLEQLRLYLQVLKGLKSVTVETTVEDGVTVAHGVWKLAE